jgi:hypothetical protein
MGLYLKWSYELSPPASVLLPAVSALLFGTFTALEPLSTFYQHQASGAWLLRLSRDAMQPLEVTIDRFEIRLHVDPSSPCV